jgi:hypothetical protein
MNQLVLFKEIIAVFNNNNMKQVTIIRGHNAELLVSQYVVFVVANVLEAVKRSE